MTVSTTLNRVSYTGNGVTTAFAFPYYFLAAGDLVVYKRNTSTGVATLQVITTNYTVSGAGDPAGGTVTMLVAPSASEQVIIYRDPAVTQGVDFVNNDPLPAEPLEQALDRLTMISQRDRDLVARCIVLPDSDPTTGLVLPELSTRASKILAFDATGQILVGTTVAPSTIINAAWEATLQLSFVGLQSADAGAGVGPSWDLDRNSASPAASDVIGSVDFNGRDSGANKTLYAQVRAQIDDPTNGSEDGRLEIHTIVAGASASRLGVGDGVVVGAPVGGYKGAGTINATGLYINNVSVGASALRGYIDGLILANNGADAVNDIDIAAGVASDDTSAVTLNAGAMTKRIDATWAAGTAAGGRDSADNLVGAKWFHVYIFRRSGGTDDYVLSTSTTPTLPDGGTLKRRIGSVRWDGATLVAFKQYGEEFLWNVSVRDVAGAVGPAATTVTLSIPTGFKVWPIIGIMMSNSGDIVLASALDVSDQAPSATLAPLASTYGSATFIGTGPYRIRSNTSGQIRMRSSAANTVYVATHGWIDPRGRDA